MGAKKGRHPNVDEAMFHTKISSKEKKVTVYNNKQCIGGRKNCKFSKEVDLKISSNEKFDVIHPRHYVIM